MKVFTLTLWATGTGTSSLYTTRETAYQTVVDFVGDHWDPEIMGRDINEFDCNEDLVDYFFDLLDPDYRYRINLEWAYGPPEVAKEAPLGPDEVVLTPQEVAVVVCSLSCARASEVAIYTKMPTDEAWEAIASAHKKLKD